MTSYWRRHTLLLIGLLTSWSWPIVSAANSFGGEGEGGGEWKASLDRVNTLRKVHRAPVVELSADLNAAAQDWADQLAEYSLWQHSATPFGENIAGGWSPTQEEYDWSDKNSYVLTAIDLWYAEVKDYDYKNPKWEMKTGHFTQLVWQDTDEIGIGVAYNQKTKAVYVVMNFLPSGNMYNAFVANVLPPVEVKALNGGNKKPKSKKPPPRRPPPRQKGKGRHRAMLDYGF